MPGLPEQAAAEGLTPLEFMRRYGAFEIAKGVGAQYTSEVPAEELDDVDVDDRSGRVYTRDAEARRSPTSCRCAPPDPDADGRRPVGVDVDGVVRRGFPTPSGKLEFYSSTLADWGWPEHALPGYIKSHVHPDAAGARSDGADLDLPAAGRRSTPAAPTPSGSTRSRTPTRCGSTPPTRDGSASSTPATWCACETEIGYFVVKAWVTEGIRPASSPAATTWAAGSTADQQGHAAA